MPLPTEEQVMLREMAHNWAQKDAPVAALRALRDSGNELGFDAATFASIAEMGWAGTIIPESYGGSDVGYASMSVVLEELGRTLVAAPLIGSAVGAASAIKLGGSETQQSAWLPAIAEGKAIASLAIDETTRFAPERITLGATAGADGFTLTGTKLLVHEGMAADVFVVAARTSGNAADREGVTLLVVPGDAPGISRKRRRLLDSRGYADVTFAGTRVDADAVLGRADHGRELLDRVLDYAAAAAAAEALGLARQAFDITLDYLKLRTQFGQVIGTFQALQHRAAKLFTDIELAGPCLDEAMHALDTDAPDAPALVSLAKATINDLVHTVSREMIQLHGGIGMTDAHDAGFYLKRARALEAAFGTSAYHRERYARLHAIESQSCLSFGQGDAMPIIDHRDVPEMTMRPGIRGRFLAHKDLGSTGVSLLANTVDPGAEAPLHTHTVEETMLVLEGTVWTQVGGERRTIGPNHTVIIPPHTPHAWGNPGPGVARLLWAFAGSDPFADATYLEGTPPRDRPG